MANVIKHKRGTSDPSPSDLEVGEIGIRTDVGKLFTKTDSGSVAEIAGGGSDIIINTLSSSSATGGGSATFNGSAYRFTLSQPPSVSAQQLLVSIAGVIQKPVAGNGQPSEGFSINGNDIILASAPATGTDFFILTFKSLGVSEPADNTVTNAKVASNAAIAGTKVSPDFGSQNIATTGNVTIGGSLIHAGDTNTRLEFDTDTISLKTNGDEILRVTPAGHISIVQGNLYLQDKIIHGGDGDTMIRFPADDTVSVEIAGTERLRIDSSGHVGIGTTSPSALLDVELGSTGTIAQFRGADTDILNIDGDSNQVTLDARNVGAFAFEMQGSEAMRIDSSGRVLVRGQAAFTSTSLDHRLQVKCQNTGDGIAIIGRNGDHSSALSFTQLDASTLTGSLSANATQFRVRSESSLIFQTNGGNERMRIDSSGNVGIGTTSPAAELHVESATPEIRIKSTNANVGQGTEIGRLAIHTNDPTTPTGAGEVFKITTYSAQGNGADYGTKLINRAGSNSGESVISLGQDAVGDIVFYTNTTGSGQEAMRINRRGFITKPRQAMFEARGNNTAFSAQSPLPYPSVAYNIGSCYDNTTYKFTAPVDGYYQVMAHVIPTDYTAGGNNVELYVMDNHGTRYFLDRKLKSSNYSSNNFSVGGTRIIYADYTDTLWLQFHAISGTPKVETASFFSIMLVA